jgi:hypothetical protein
MALLYRLARKADRGEEVIMPLFKVRKHHNRTYSDFTSRSRKGLHVHIANNSKAYRQKPKPQIPWYVWASIIFGTIFILGFVLGIMGVRLLPVHLGQ